MLYFFRRAHCENNFVAPPIRRETHYDGKNNCDVQYCAVAHCPRKNITHPNHKYQKTGDIKPGKACIFVRLIINSRHKLKFARYAREINRNYLSFFLHLYVEEIKLFNLTDMLFAISLDFKYLDCSTLLLLSISSSQCFIPSAKEALEI